MEQFLVSGLVVGGREVDRLGTLMKGTKEKKEG